MSKDRVFFICFAVLCVVEVLLFVFAPTGGGKTIGRGTLPEHAASSPTPSPLPACQERIVGKLGAFYRCTN